MTTHTALIDYYASATLDNGSLLCDIDTDDTVFTATSTDEINSGGGVYKAVFSNVTAGMYRLKLLDVGEVIAIRYAVLAGANNEVVLATTLREALDIQSRIPATLDGGNMRSSVQSMATDTLTASALAADAVAEIAAAVNGSSGSGARTVTITVTLNSNPVEGATVRLTKSAETYTGTTNASGVVTFNVDDGTWTVAITAAGASFAGASLVVDGNETQTYTLTATSITPSSTGLVTGYWVCYSHLGVVESGVSITMICKKVPAESGFALDSATRTATSGADGIAQFANLIPGATYQVARGTTGQNFMIKVPDDASGTIELNSILGN